MCCAFVFSFATCAARSLAHPRFFFCRFYLHRARTSPCCPLLLLLGWFAAANGCFAACLYLSRFAQYNRTGVMRWVSRALALLALRRAVSQLEADLQSACNTELSKVCLVLKKARKMPLKGALRGDIDRAGLWWCVFVRAPRNPPLVLPRERRYGM